MFCFLSCFPSSNHRSSKKRENPKRRRHWNWGKYLNAILLAMWLTGAFIYNLILEKYSYSSRCYEKASRWKDSIWGCFSSYSWRVHNYYLLLDYSLLMQSPIYSVRKSALLELMVCICYQYYNLYIRVFIDESISGAGKSTFMKVIAELDTEYDGEITRLQGLWLMNVYTMCLFVCKWYFPFVQL